MTRKGKHFTVSSGLWVVLILILTWVPDQYLRTWLGGRLFITYFILNTCYFCISFIRWLNEVLPDEN